jgi:hypothetical protein
MINLPSISAVPATLPSYCTLAEGLVIAAALPAADVAAFLVGTSDVQTAALAAATSDIEVAMFYQGRKFGNADGTLQVLEFPRYLGTAVMRYGDQLGPIGDPLGIPVAGYQTMVWDWDATHNVAVVPDAVKRACVIQASSRIAGKRDARLDARHDGVSEQNAGGLKEIYGGERKVLCRRADEIMQRYRLRSGEMV